MIGWLFCLIVEGDVLIYIYQNIGVQKEERGGAGDTKKGFNVTLWGGSILFNQIREVCDVI